MRIIGIQGIKHHQASSSWNARANFYACRPIQYILSHALFCSYRARIGLGNAIENFV